MWQLLFWVSVAGTAYACRGIPAAPLPLNKRRRTGHRHDVSAKVLKTRS